MDLRKLKTLIDLVSESNISELEITEAEGKVRIVKASAAPGVVAMPGMQMVPATTPPAAAGLAAALAAAAAANAPEEPAPRVIKSPMVGTFSRAASPGAKNFADVGDVIKEGDPVCIIEAMKIMNEIEADKPGTITRVLVEDGRAVEFGQALFVIE